MALVYGAIGVPTCLIRLAFAFTPLGHEDRYIPQPDSERPSKESAALAEECAQTR